MRAGKQVRVTDSAGVIQNSRAGVSETNATADAGGGDGEGTKADLACAKSLFRLSLGALRGCPLRTAVDGTTFFPPTLRLYLTLALEYLATPKSLILNLNLLQMCAPMLFP